ncbi:MAG: hypothetical protein LRZ88_06450 [Candidatus Cloacimonetes bacterium]|nr:hypothetical protein [Candidatus Cloacimonadota bacterium]
MPSPKTNPVGRLEREIRSLTGRLSKSSSSTGAEIAEIQAAIAGIVTQIGEIVPGDPEAITAIQEQLTILSAQIDDLIEQGVAVPEEVENYRKALIAMFPGGAIHIFESQTWGGDHDSDGLPHQHLRCNARKELSAAKI